MFTLLACTHPVVIIHILYCVFVLRSVSWFEQVLQSLKTAPGNEHCAARIGVVFFSNDSLEKSSMRISSGKMDNMDKMGHFASPVAVYAKDKDSVLIRANDSVLIEANGWTKHKPDPLELRVIRCLLDDVAAGGFSFDEYHATFEKYPIWDGKHEVGRWTIYIWVSHYAAPTNWWQTK